MLLIIRNYFKYLEILRNFFNLGIPTLSKLLLFILPEKLFKVKGPSYFNGFVPKRVALTRGI